MDHAQFYISSFFPFVPPRNLSLQMEVLMVETACRTTSPFIPLQHGLSDCASKPLYTSSGPGMIL